MIEIFNIRFENGFIYCFVNDRDLKQSGNVIFSCDTEEITGSDNKNISRGTLFRVESKLLDLINEYGLLDLPESASYVFV